MESQVIEKAVDSKEAKKVISFTVELAPELCPTFIISEETNGRITELFEASSEQSLIHRGGWDYGFMKTFLEWREDHPTSPIIEQQKVIILEKAYEVLAQHS